MSDTRPAGEPVDETVEQPTDVPAYGSGAAEGSDAVWTPDGYTHASTDAPVDAAAEASPGTADGGGGASDATWTRDGEAPATDAWTGETESGSASAADEYVPGSYSTPLYDAEPAAEPAAATRVIPPAAEAETVVVAPVVAEPVRQQPIFVQAPEAPVARGNRGAAGAIGLLAAVVFAVLYLGVALGLGALTGAVTGETVVDVLVDALTSWAFWVPVAVFFLAFWLLGAFINRGRWGAWVVFGLLVGLASYAGAILGVLVEAPFWTLTAREGAALVETQLLSPLAVAAFVIGRELTIWFGAWVARRGRRVTELNAEAQREYERTLEAGPKLYAS